MTQIHRWLGNATSILAGWALCSCVATYVPDKSAPQNIGVEEARKIVMGAARAPALIFDKVEPVQDNQISKAYVGRTFISITGRNGKIYDVILKNCNPSYETNYNGLRAANGWAYIYLDNRKEIGNYPLDDLINTS